MMIPGCNPDGTDDPVSISLGGTAQMRLKMEISPDLGIDSGTVTISKGELVYSQPLVFEGNVATVLFENLQPGLWLIDVELRDEDGYVLYEGNGEAEVVGGQTATATIVVEELSGGLEVIIEMPGSISQAKIVFQYGGIHTMNADGSDVVWLSSGYDPDWSLDGAKIAFTKSGFDIHIMNADGSEIQNLADTSTRDVFPEWSPDGSQIAFSRKQDGQWQVYVMDSDGSNQQNLSSNAWDDMYPAWSPDGTKIAFVSWRDGNEEIYLMDANGSNQTNFSDNPAYDVPEAWSPDGARLLITTDRDGNRELYSINVDGTDPVNLTNHSADDYQATWSYDGLWIAFVSNRDGNRGIYLMRADGSGLVDLTQDSGFDSRPDWNVRPE